MSERPDLEGIRARVEAATPGPWVFATDKGAPDYVQLYSTAEIDEYQADVLSADDLVFVSEPDATFIAAARTDIPALVSYIEELEGERDRLRQTLEGVVHLHGATHTGITWPCGICDAVAAALDATVVAPAEPEVSDE